MRKRGLAVLTVILMLCLAAGCAANENQPVVTNDDLTPFSPTSVNAEDGAGGEQGGEAQSAVRVPEPEKDYAYNWPAEDMEASEARLREEVETYALSMGGTEQEQAAYIEDCVQSSLDSWREQRALDPVVSPQEAANRAGRLFETLYGKDLTDKKLRLYCFLYSGETNANRPAWWVRIGDDTDDGSSIWNPGAYDQIDCKLDATTGEIISVKWIVSNEEYTEIQREPMPDCFIPIKVPSGWMKGGWDETHPNFEATMDALIDEFSPLVSESILTNGARVTSVQYKLIDREIPDETVNKVAFFVACENGKTYIMQRNEAIQPFLEYDFDGYPLRAYYFMDAAYTAAS